MANDFNLQKFLIENRMTRNSRLLMENTQHTELKPLEDILLQNGYRFYKDVFQSKSPGEYSNTATYEKKVDDLNTHEITLFKNYESDMGADKGKTFPVRVLYFVADDYTFKNGKKLNRGQADISYDSIDNAKEDLEGISKL
jgi:hypothetical protein